MLWPRDQKQGVPARLAPGVSRPRVAAGVCSATPLNTRKPEGTRTGWLPRKHSSLPACPVLEPRPSSVPWQGLSGLQYEPASALSREESKLARLGEPHCGTGTPGPFLLPCSVGEVPVAAGSPSQTPVPRALGSQGLRVAAFRAGGQPPESSKEALCFQGGRQGKGHLPLLNE